APKPGADEIEHGDRKAAVYLRALRQIGDVACIEAVERDRARQRLEDADQAAKQRRLAGAVRSDHRQQSAACHLAGQGMHRRMAVVTESNVVELQLRRHGFTSSLTTPPPRARR